VLRTVIRWAATKFALQVLALSRRAGIVQVNFMPIDIQSPYAARRSLGAVSADVTDLAERARLGKLAQLNTCKRLASMRPAISVRSTTNVSFPVRDAGATLAPHLSDISCIAAPSTAIVLSGSLRPRRAEGRLVRHRRLRAVEIEGDADVFQGRGQRRPAGALQAPQLVHSERDSRQVTNRCRFAAADSSHSSSASARA
jgi:hypothetical protein